MKTTDPIETTFAPLERQKKPPKEAGSLATSRNGITRVCSHDLEESALELLFKKFKTRPAMKKR